MIKGAFIFAGGLAVGTCYGVLLGFKATKAINLIAEKVEVTDVETPAETVQGQTVA